jgi:hypothetical protein
MLRYEVLRGQWLLATLGGGLILMLTTVATYLAIWRPRSGPSPAPPEGSAKRENCTFAMTFLQALPVVLLLTYVGIAIFMVIYFADMIVSPPNW